MGATLATHGRRGWHGHGVDTVTVLAAAVPTHRQRAGRARPPGLCQGRRRYPFPRCRCRGWHVTEGLRRWRASPRHSRCRTLRLSLTAAAEQMAPGLELARGEAGPTLVLPVPVPRWASSWHNTSLCRSTVQLPLLLPSSFCRRVTCRYHRAPGAHPHLVPVAHQSQLWVRPHSPAIGPQARGHPALRGWPLPRCQGSEAIGALVLGIRLTARGGPVGTLSLPEAEEMPQCERPSWPVWGQGWGQGQATSPWPSVPVTA